MNFPNLNVQTLVVNNYFDTPPPARISPSYPKSVSSTHATSGSSRTHRAIDYPAARGTHDLDHSMTARNPALAPERAIMRVAQPRVENHTRTSHARPEVPKTDKSKAPSKHRPTDTREPAAKDARRSPPRDTRHDQASHRVKDTEESRQPRHSHKDVAAPLHRKQAPAGQREEKTVRFKEPGRDTRERKVHTDGLQTHNEIKRAR